MVVITNHNLNELVHQEEVQHQGFSESVTSSNFIEANTLKVSLEHLKNECNIPVFAKDNESTISHYQFINEIANSVNGFFEHEETLAPQIRVSHVIKGRIPSAIGKPVKELLENEKTIYYERCAFIIEIPSVKANVNGNELILSVGGVRAYNQENLYSCKSLEKFKLFIGFKNNVCTNLCVSSDGFTNEIRIGSRGELPDIATELFNSYNRKEHLLFMQKMNEFVLNEKQFAHLIGKLRMYFHLPKSDKSKLFSIGLNDGQVGSIVRDYYTCPNFGRNDDGSISLWQLYNLLTEANKSSYIDTNFERNVNAYELIENLANSIEYNNPNWLLHNII